MTFIVFPTGNDAGGGKTVKEIYWAPLTELITNKTFAYAGLTVPASVPGSLDIPVAAGKCIIRSVLGAYYVELDEEDSITLSASSTNYVYLKFTLDVNDKVLSAELATNTSGIQPDNSIKICSAITDETGITSTTDLRPRWAWHGTYGHDHDGTDGEGPNIPFENISGVLDPSQLPLDLTGISADMVDGQHADEFAAFNHLHDSTYVNVTGDTMTGNLVIDKASPEISLTGSSGDAEINLGSSFLIGTKPKIDLKFGVGTSQGYNVRIENSANKVVNIYSEENDAVLQLNGLEVLVDGQSVIDSDKLDGYHSGSFVLKAGDTMTGDLAFEYYGTTRNIKFKSQGTDKWGIYGHATSMGFTDWAHSRTPFAYNTVTGAVSLGTPDGGLDFYSTSGSLVFLHVGASQYKIWNEGNDGASSGLDADKLDGLHASDIDVTYIQVIGGWCFGHLLHHILHGALHWAFGNENTDTKWWGFIGHPDNGLSCHDWLNDREVWWYDHINMIFKFNHAHDHMIGPWWIHHGGHAIWSWCDEWGAHRHGFEHHEHGIHCHDWANNRNIWTYDDSSLTFVFNDEHTHYIGTHPIWHEGNLAQLYEYLDARYVQI